MPLTGGPADKYGNRYEGRWTVRCFIEMLEGHAEKIRLEPPGDLSEGAEFVLHRPPYREFHQVKRQYGKEYAWNLAVLNSRKVLPRFRERLLGSDNEHERCVFVSTHSAHPLDELTDRARSAANAGEFEKHFDEGPHFQTLLKYWNGLASEDAWAALKRIEVTIIGEKLLQQWNAERVGVLVEGHPDTVTDVLAQYALDSVHQELDADAILAHLESRGHSARDWAPTGGPSAGIARSASSFVATAKRQAIAGQILRRAEAEAVCMKLEAGAKQVVIAGGRGLGKSGVAAQVVSDRLSKGWKVLVLRAGAYEEWMSPMDVGTELGLDASPTTALAGVAGQQPSLLLIDQLDDVALGGDSSNFFECVRVMVESAAMHENLAVVLACRSVDIEDDPRIRELVGDDTRNRVEVKPLDVDRVTAVVDATGLPSAELNDEQLRILSVPLQLQLFVKAADRPEIMGFGSPDDLYACLNARMRALDA